MKKLLPLLCASIALALPAAAASASGLVDALRSGSGGVDLRYRMEIVDQAMFPDDAIASTLRTAIHYRTGKYQHFDYFLEMSNVADLGSGPYSLPGDPMLNYPVILDPQISRVNQSYLRWSRGNGLVKAGRQELIYGNARFVGNVGWRQNHQNFDSVRAEWTFGGNLDARYTFIGQVNRVTGSDQDLLGHVFNLDYEFEKLGTVGAYALLLDFDDAPVLSTNTFGGYVSGDSDLDGGWSLHWRAEYAMQQDGYDNPVMVDASYMHFIGGVGLDAVHFRAGFEQLSGDADDGQFNTTFATAHKFNGWADRFVITPVEGLNDLYFTLDADWKDFSATATWHDFSAESSDLAYGTEIDAQLGYTFSWDQFLAVKAAFYSGSGELPMNPLTADVTKTWVYTTFSF